MNSSSFLDKDGNILRVPARLSFSSALASPHVLTPRSRGFSIPKQRIVREPSIDEGEGLYAYAMSAQQRNESLERLAFAALASAGVAGILSAFM